MRCRKLILLLCLSFFSCCSVLSHELPKEGHAHYSFKVLQQEVDSDSLIPDDVERLLSKLHFWNCSDVNESTDYRKCLSPSDLYSFAGSSSSNLLNSTEFVRASPLIVYCLLPAPEKNAGRCKVSPKHHSELFNSFARNFSQHGDEGNITVEALDHILEEVNKTIGQFLTRKKCFSAESIFEEIEEQEEEEHHEEEGEHHGQEEKALHQEDFEKACASIVLHLVQGFCIEEAHGHNETESNLPSKESFINDLFNKKKHLSEGDLEAIMKLLNIGKEEDSDSHSDHSGHDHRRRRSAASVLLPQQGSGAPHGVHRRAVDDHDHDHSKTNGDSNDKCYSLEQMLTIFGIDHEVGADMFDFKELCPAFIQQARSGACSKTNDAKPASEKNMAKIWGYGFLAVTIISITSLVGVATIPFFGKRMYKKILATLVALAVGTLAGDSLLHLLPHAFGLHAHEDEGAEHDSHEEDSGFIWKALVVLASVYAFFLFETLMHLGLKSKIGDHGHSHVDVDLPGPSSRHMSFKKRRSCSQLEHHEGAPPIGNSDEKPPMENGDIVLTNVEGPMGNYNSSPSCTFHSHCVYEHVSSTDTDGGEYEHTKSDLEDGNAIVPPDSTVKPKKTLKQSLSRRSVFSDEERTKNPPQKISAVAWMIIIGDTLHNISDGLAIGAAFSEGGTSGVSGGISTSIAVFCHELPHELGDFAVLLTAGMTVKMALLANLLSAMSCYIGLVIGILVGQQADARFWIFAIAAGMFLYVALVDMLPDLMHSETLQTEPVVTFLCQNFGLLLGISIMLVIALYEEDLMAVTW